MQLEEIFVSILNMSITAGYAILAVIVLRLFLKRTPRWITLVLWGIASFRLIFPFSLESVLSVFSVIPSSDTVTPEILYADAPTIHSGIPVVNSAVNPGLSEAMAPVADASMSPMQTAAYIAGIIWLVGIAALLIYSVIAYIKLKRKTLSATTLRDNVCQCENVASPFLLGFIKPKVYLPYSLAEPELSHVLSHENAHIKRRDYLLKPLAFFILALHWFNPLVWVAYLLFCRDIELACDEKVYKTMSPDMRKSYSSALLSLAVRGLGIPACPLAFGEVSVKNRVKKALSYKKPAFWIIIAALLACAVAAVCLLTDPVAKTEPDSTSTTGGFDEPQNVSITDISELYGTYHPAKVIYVNPLSSFYPYDLDTSPYYTFAENEFTVVTPGQQEPVTYSDPQYTRSTLSTSEFESMFMVDFEKPDISGYESIERITVNDDYSLFIIGTELWLADVNGENFWLIYRLEPSDPYVPELFTTPIPSEGPERLSIYELAGIIRDRGNDISWGDFADLEHYDFGSGLYIWRLPINENYCVLIGGASPDEDPMYVRLVRLSASGEITDEYLELLDENTDVHIFFADNFGIETEPHTWVYNPLLSSVFPALPVSVDMRYSTVDVTVNSGSLYSHGNGTQHLGDTHIYSFGETIYWSPLSKDSHESDEELRSDVAAYCTLSFSIMNSEGEAISSGSIYIEQTGISNDGVGGYDYRFWMMQTDGAKLELNPDPNSWRGFTLTIE